LPWGEPTELRLPDFDALDLEENDRLGRRFIGSGQWFEAHEAWETAWKQARGTGDEELFKGLSQMGAGYVHLLRGNAHGAIVLLRRGAGRVGAYPDGHRGLATAAIREHLESHAASVEAGALVPGPDAAFEPPPV